MSKQVFNRCILLMAVPLLLVGSTAFGWAGTTHALLCQRNFDLPVVSQFLGGVDQSAIENYIGEPDGHSGQWTGISGRYYIDTAGSYSGFSYNALPETQRLQALMHHAGDVSVPAHHYPAGIVYDSTYAEGLCEIGAAGGYLTVGELPNVANTTSYTHTRNGHSYNFTGTIYDIMDTYYDACTDNASWFKSTKKWWGHYPSDIADANWNALKIDLMLQRAVFVDYFLAKLPEQAICDGDHVLGPGGTSTFDASASYDPDAITWNSNGTYSPTNGWMAGYYWDYNNDGVWDWIDNDPKDDNRSYDYFLSLGIPTGQWQTYTLGVYDDEGHFDTCNDGRIYLYPSGGVPEPASLSLLAVGALALLRRRRR